LLKLGALLLRVGTLPQRLELGRHLLHGVVSSASCPATLAMSSSAGIPPRFYVRNLLAARVRSGLADGEA
jgi:hypothetical protein